MKALLCFLLFFTAKCNFNLQHANFVLYEESIQSEWLLNTVVGVLCCLYWILGIFWFAGSGLKVLRLENLGLHIHLTSFGKKRRWEALINIELNSLVNRNVPSSNIHFWYGSGQVTWPLLQNGYNDSTCCIWLLWKLNEQCM